MEVMKNRNIMNKHEKSCNWFCGYHPPMSLLYAAMQLPVGNSILPLAKSGYRNSMAISSE